MVKKVHFVTGKGGGGKSTLAAAFAYKISQTGARTLLTEFNDQSFFEDFLKTEKVSYSPINFRTQLDLALWSPESCLKEYAIHLLKVESLYRLFFENPVSKSLIQIAPGLHELALLGKATSSPREHGPVMKYDEIVIDSYSTGHFLSLLRAPSAMAQAIQFGPMGEQSRGIDKWLRNSDFTKVKVVSLPESLPATESIELYEQLLSEFGIKAQVVMNKLWKIENSHLQKLPSTVQSHFKNKMAEESEALARFSSKSIPLLQVPLITEVDSVKLIEKISEYLND